MRPILIYWRDLDNETKQKLKSKHNIKKVTYSDIKMLYAETKK